MNQEETIAHFNKCEAARKAALDDGKSEDEAHEAAKEVWNAWADNLLAQKKVLQDKGEWKVKNDGSINFRDVGENEQTKAWFKKANLDFTTLHFITPESGLKNEVQGGEENAADRNSDVKSIHFYGNAINFNGYKFLGTASFDSVMFFGYANFHSATFSGDAHFHSATFSSAANFHSATFSGDANVRSATFSGNANFRSATFSGDAHFHSTTFSGDANFRSATFSGDAHFHSTTFSSSAHFLFTTFSGNVNFRSATFSGDAHFHSATFSGDAHFHSTTFSGNAHFYSTTFSGNANFYSATFSRTTDFSSTTFSRYTDFHSATFSSSAIFYSTTFSSSANFSSATFSRYTDFGSATFSRYADFRSAMFSGYANFYSTTFSGDAHFHSTTFSGNAHFYSTTFSGNAGFDSATFHQYTNFSLVKFKSEANFSAMESHMTFNLSRSKFHKVPNFLDVKFKDDEPPNLDNVKVRGKRFITFLYNNDIAYATKFRKLKKMAIQAHYNRGELAFHAEELRGERFMDLMGVGVPKIRTLTFWFSILYGIFSNFGRSVIRPFVSWVALVLFFGFFYLSQHAWISKDIEILRKTGHPKPILEVFTKAYHEGEWRCVPLLEHMSTYSKTTLVFNKLSDQKSHITATRVYGTTNALLEAFYLSVKNGFVFIDWDRSESARRTFGCLYGLEKDGSNFLPIVPWSVSIANIIQNILSAILIFLFGLALRNMLKLK